MSVGMMSVVMTVCMMRVVMIMSVMGMFMNIFMTVKGIVCRFTANQHAQPGQQHCQETGEASPRPMTLVAVS